MPEKEMCPICGTTLKEPPHELNPDLTAIICGACGTFEITGTALSMVHNKEDFKEKRHILSGLIRERSERGDFVSIDSSYETNLLPLANVPKDPFEAIDRILLYLKQHSDHPGACVTIPPSNSYPITYSKNQDEFLFYVLEASKMGYLKLWDKDGDCQLLTGGWRRIKEIETPPKLKTYKQSDAVIFLSHNHRDKDFVRQLASDLERHGVGVWLDEAELKIGDSLIQKITSAINEVDYLAVILSPNSVQSRWVQEELEQAFNLLVSGKLKKILPLLIEECEIPSFLGGKIYADFRNNKNYYAELLKVVNSVE